MAAPPQEKLQTFVKNNNSSSTRPLTALHEEEEEEQESFSAGGGLCGCCGFFWGQSSNEDRYLLRQKTGENRGGEGGGGGGGAWWSAEKLVKKAKEASEVMAGPKWKTFLRKLGNKNKKGRFQYDPRSYALNFDDAGDGRSPDDDDFLLDFSDRRVASSFSDDKRVINGS
ncbi:uncharacterized protein LOC131157901 [Malania oleifera]|uniref:uncharacterized protein LOC131157901 n=1 Tax=Malania oleifera TaxID=397392 RepID=UPI0025AE1E68|nr:uncharacterized protein LOC131157901 [Malania oleifera]